MNNIDYNDWLNDLALTVVLFPVAVSLVLMFGAYRTEQTMRRWFDGDAKHV